MKRYLLRIGLILIMLFVVNIFLFGPQAQQQYLSNYYSRWRNSPIPELVQKASGFQQGGQKDSALHYYSMVANRYYEKQYQPQDMPMIIKSLSIMGNLYNLQFFDYRQSYDCLTLAEKLSLENGYRKELPSIYLSLGGLAFTDGSVRHYQNYLPDAITLYKKSYHEALEQEQYDIAVRTFINLINFSRDSTALSGIQDEIASFESLTQYDAPLYHYAMMLMHGTQAQVQRNYDAAIQYYKQMEPYVADSTAGNLRYRLVIKSRLSVVCFLSGNEALGLQYLHEMEQKADADSIIDLQVGAYRVLNQYYSDHNNKEKALHYHMLYLEAKDAMLEKHNLESMQNAKFLNELNSANEEIRRMTYERRTQRWILMGVSIFAVLLLFLIAFVIHHYRELQARNQSIYRQMARSLEAERHSQLSESVSATLTNVMPEPQLAEPVEVHPVASSADLISNEDTADEPAEVSSKYRNYTLTDEEKERIYQKILEAMRDVSLFCSDSFSIQSLSDHIDERSRYVSQVINEKYGSNFPSFVNEFRIREACRRIMDQEHYGQLSLSGIGKSVGIKSGSQFSTIFKKVVGMTAAEYLREAKK